MNKKPQIVFFGTPDFAVPTLKALINASFCDVKMVVTQPDKPVGRHHSKLAASPVKRAAQENGLLIIDEILRLRSQMSTSGRSAQDDALLGVLVAYGNIIPKKLIDSFPLGILNIHPSLLPEYRGSSPIQAAILNQDKKTGVTIMKLDNKMDHGPIVAQEAVSLQNNDSMTAGELHDKLAIVGADLLIKILPDYIAGKIKPKAQDESKATYTKKLTKKDGQIKLNPTAKSPACWSGGIGPLVRAMNPWPGAWTTYKGKKLIIWSTTKEGEPIEVQLEGKKRMPYGAFLKGHPDFSIKNIA